MDLKSGVNRPSLGKLLAMQFDQVSKDCGVAADGAGLKVEKGETVLLTFESERFRAAFRQMKPRSIDEIRQLVGVSPSVAAFASAQPGATPGCGCSKPSRFRNIDELDSPEPAVRGKALSAARLDARNYVRSGARASASQKAFLDRYVQLTDAVLNLAFLADIEIQDGATLVIAPGTHALYARNIRIHGSGRIVCQGPTTINCQRINGDYKNKWTSITATPNLINNTTFLKES